MKEQVYDYLCNLFLIGGGPSLPKDRDAVIAFLKNPSDLIENEHRERLLTILLSDDTRATKSDIRFLIRYSKGRGEYSGNIDNTLISNTNMIPYEMLEIWEANVALGDLNPWNDVMGFTMIPEGTTLEKLLGIVAISPQDKEFIEEVAQRMALVSQSNPNLAHVVIDDRFYERYPQKGVNYMRSNFEEQS